MHICSWMDRIITLDGSDEHCGSLFPTAFPSSKQSMAAWVAWIGSWSIVEGALAPIKLKILANKL